MIIYLFEAQQPINDYEFIIVKNNDVFMKNQIINLIYVNYSRQNQNLEY